MINPTHSSVVVTIDVAATKLLHHLSVTLPSGLDARGHVDGELWVGGDGDSVLVHLPIFDTARLHQRLHHQRSAQGPRWWGGRL